MKFQLLAVAIGLGCGAALAAERNAPTPDLKPIVAGEAATGPQATGFAPLAYFNENCARCHGDYGSAYGDEFAKNRDDASLREVVHEMAEGPGQAPLSEAELDIETEFHRALRDKKPFVVIVKSEKTDAGWQLSGEVSPGATLQINGETVEIEGANWSHCVAPGAVKLRAQQGETVTELDANVAALAE